MEDARVAPHSPRSVPTNFDVNSEYGLIHDNISRAESLSSGRNKNYQCQYKNWFRAAKEEEWEICSSLWQGAMISYLHMKSFLGKEKTIELLGGQKKELEITPALEKEGPVVSTSCRSVQRQAQRTSEEAERSQEPSRQGKRQSQLAQTLPTMVQDSRLELSAVDSVFNMARTLMELTAKEQERMNRTIPRK
ncbi:hypothetical protein O181_051484 [Austropuccinia psidii MF-1]|uniref:Uncharacterized protein n=1 Tax=Austropuccinia psidii MF-1 TaxID=1389203 RepID=A0A9Q3DYW7_9BASI|nr:hypothetical protein [Austropuccinia psidii MF-1]